MKSAVPDEASPPAAAAAAAEAVPGQRRSPVWPYFFGITWLLLAGEVAVTMREIPQIALTLMVLAAALFLYAFLRARSRRARGIALVFLLGTACLVYDYGVPFPAPLPSLPFSSPPSP